MKIGKVGKLLLICGIVGLLNTILSIIFPAFFGWFRMEITNGVSTVRSGISVIGTAIELSGSEPFLLVGGIIVIAGSILFIIAGLKESRGIGLAGGILIFIDIIILILDLLIFLTGPLSEIIESWGGPSNVFALFGIVTIPGSPNITIYWGIWIGAFIAFGTGIIGIIAANKLKFKANNIKQNNEME